MTGWSSGSCVEPVEDGRLQQGLGLGLLRAVDVDLGLEDRHEPGVEDLAADLELLVDDGVDRRPRSASLMTERIFVPNMPLASRPRQQLVEAGRSAS